MMYMICVMQGNVLQCGVSVMWTVTLWYGLAGRGVILRFGASVQYSVEFGGMSVAYGSVVWRDVV